MYDRIAVTCGDHQIVDGIDCDQFFGIDLQQTVDLGIQLDLALFHIGPGHVVDTAEGSQPLGSLILVQHAFGLFPYIQVLLSHGEQDGNVLFRDDMTLAEAGILGNAGDDLRHIMAEYVSDSFFGLDEFHNVFLPHMVMVYLRNLIKGAKAASPLRLVLYHITKGFSITNRLL